MPKRTDKGLEFKLMNSMSFGALTCLARYLIFHKIKVYQMMNWSAPLRRAH
jgi:hypothetical protein